MTILERLRAATGPLKTSDANDLAYDAGYHGENYALMVAALRGGIDAVGSALALLRMRFLKLGLSKKEPTENQRLIARELFTAP